MEKSAQNKRVKIRKYLLKTYAYIRFLHIFSNFRTIYQGKII